MLVLRRRKQLCERKIYNRSNTIFMAVDLPDFLARQVLEQFEEWTICRENHLTVR